MAIGEVNLPVNIPINSGDTTDGADVVPEVVPEDELTQMPTLEQLTGKTTFNDVTRLFPQSFCRNLTFLPFSGATGRLPIPVVPVEPPTIGIPQLPPPEVTDPQGFGGIPLPPTSELARAAGILTASGVGIYCLAKIIPLAIAFFFPPSAPVMIPAALLV